MVRSLNVPEQARREAPRQQHSNCQESEVGMAEPPADMPCSRRLEDKYVKSGKVFREK